MTSGSGALYHFECFKCVACGKDFPDMKFVEKPEGVYHPDVNFSFSFHIKKKN